ncbi:MAG: TonB-dependent receptor [Bacteroidales bacterium]|nr:TonB-dependent receptor [Bacteroidales bacterium]
MKLTTLFSIALSLNLGASVYSQNTKFSLDLNGKTVREVFQILEQQSQFRFFYNDDFNYIDNVVSMNIENQNVEQILEKLFETSDITYKVFNDNLVVLTPKTNLQQVAIKGTITDASTQEPLPGANVQVKGTTRGAVADVDGNFSIDAKAGDVLVVSFIGYMPEEITVTNQTVLNVALAPDVQSLEEVVVVGYGTQKRIEVTGAVTSVTSEKLTAIPTGTLDQALQGRAAGVTVINNGAPGTAPTMRVRGINTVNNNDPLYVVDGVIASSIAGINPNDIESMQILKDASTTAIYGSQGSNGVIMITTKKGSSAAKSVISFDAYYGTQWSNARYDVMNNDQYEQYAVEAWGGAAVFNNPVYADRLNGILPGRPEGGETDWQDEIFQKGKMENYNLSASGGTENASFRVSAGYLNQEGIFINTGYERYNVRANSDFKIGRLKIGENIGISFARQRPELNSGGRSLIEHAIKSAPYLPVYNPDNKGGFQGPNSGVDGQDAENPVRIMKLNHWVSNSTGIIGDLYAELEIINGLKFKSLVGYEVVRVLDDQFQPSYDDDNIDATHNAPNAIIRKNTSNYNSILFTNSLTYTKTLAEKHNFELLGVIENSEITTRTQNVSSENSITDEVRQLSQLNLSAGSNLSEYGRIGYLGRLNYNFNQKYLLAASIRKDASSRFGANNRWGTFPSVALGWNINKEAFMSNIAAISNLKLRGSWGKAGNDKIGNYAYSATLTSDMYYVINDLAVQGTTPRGAANPDLKWEETTMTNVGIDLGLFQNRFTLAAEYFINKSDDLLMPAPLANSLGDFTGSISENAGSVESKGFEFVFGYNDFEGDFQWSANLNLGTAKNEILSLGKATVIEGGGFEGDNLTRCEVGEPAFFFYGYTFDGIFQTDQEALDYLDGSQATVGGAAAGDFRIVDTDGDGSISSSDRGNIGNPFPKMTLGLDVNASYKGFDLNLFIAGAYGQDIYNTNIWDLEGMDRLFNAGTAVLDRWTPTNPSNTIPRAGIHANNTDPSTRFVQDGSYTRLKNLTLGYTVPSSILKNKITKVRIYVSGQNLITLTKYEGLDPEIGAYSVNGAGANSIGGRGAAVNFSNGIDYGNYPTPKSITTGIQLTF